MKNINLKTAAIAAAFILLFLLFKFRNNFRTDWRLAAYEVHGIDISHYQLGIDFTKLKKNKLHFVFVKVTEGVSFKDAYFSHNWANLKKHGLIRGAYHFYRPSVKAHLQAQEFIKTVKLEKGDLPPVLDFEKTDNRSTEIILKGLKIWLNTVEAHYGVKPIIYVNQNYYNTYIKDNFKGYPIWLAAYRWEKPDLKEGEWQFWQYSDRGKRAGVTGKVDLNVFHGSKKELNKLRIKFLN